MKLTHIDKKGNARMVDVSKKRKTPREAIAIGKVTMSEEIYNLIQRNLGPKGDVLTVAKIAGIMGAKRTHDLIPLCHPITLSHIDVQYTFNNKKHTIDIVSTVKTNDRTGVEMEALSCAMLVALTIYDMCKAVDKTIELGPFYLIGKSGGKSGRFIRRERT